MKPTGLPLILLFLIGLVSTAFGQAGIRAQGEDVNLGIQGQTGPGAAGVGQGIDHKQEMRKFIRKISNFTRRLDPNFIVMTEDGLDLLVKSNAENAAQTSPSATYIHSLDGVLINGLNFRPPTPGKDDIKTPTAIQKKLLKLAKLGQKRGLKIWVRDYAPNKQIAKDSAILNKVNGFLPFSSESNGELLNQIPKFPLRPFGENPRNITGIKLANNFLYINDSSLYDRQEDFMIAINNTNYDAVIIDVFHRARKPFNKNTINSMRYKKIGARRLVLAIMDIGHAESSRYYWKTAWRQGNPNYIASPTSKNPDKYYVQYWYKGWQDLITSTPKSYVYGIFKQGFDGVIIRGIEAYQFFQGSE